MLLVFEALFLILLFYHFPLIMWASPLPESLPRDKRLVWYLIAAPKRDVVRQHFSVNWIKFYFAFSRL